MGELLPDCLEAQFGWVCRFRDPAGLNHTTRYPASLRSAEPYRLRLVQSGSMEVSTRKHRWRLTGGSVLLLPPFGPLDSYTIHTFQKSDSIVVAFRLLLFGSLDITRQLIRNGIWRPQPEELTALTALMHLLLNMDTDPSSTSACMIRDGGLRAMLGLCWGAMGAESIMGGAHPVVPQWLNLVMQEIRHQPDITVSELAALTGYRHSHFFRLFQQYVGTSPRVYLQQHRLNLAKHLLSTTEMSVAAIADHLGFLNASDFTRFFRRLCLHTPSEYRQAIAGPPRRPAQEASAAE